MALERLIADDSPLARIPSELDVEQRRWLEGIRYSIEIADLAYRRLLRELVDLSQRVKGPRAGESDPLPTEVYVAAIADAWTFLDASWRLKRFLFDRRFPGARSESDRSPHDPSPVNLRPFKDAVANLGDVRDGFQHIDDEVARRPQPSKLVWGNICWSVLHTDNRTIDNWALLPGAWEANSAMFPVANSGGRLMRRRLDHVSLHGFNTVLDLSDVHIAMTAVTRDFEEMLRPQFEGFTGRRNVRVFVLTLRMEDLPSDSSDSGAA